MVHVKLERLLRAPGQIAVLRALWNAPTSLTGRQVQRLAKVHNRTAMQSLRDLEHLGLVQRRAVGRSYLCSLKRSHRVVKTLLDPLFRAERSLPQRLLAELAETLRGRCLSAVLYGSVVRGQADPGSDVDLLVVVKDQAAVEVFATVTQTKAERVIQQGWSAVLEVNLKTRKELAENWNTPLIAEIRRQGQLLAGRPLEEVRHGIAS